MNSLPDDDITQDLFHCCALIAYVEEARTQGGNPDSEATRRRAYALYEQELQKIGADKPA